MATTQEIIQTLAEEGWFASVGKGFDAFGQHLQAREGRGLTAVNPMQDVTRYYEELAKKDEYGIWLRSFYGREDVRVAAGTFAAGVRQSGDSPRLGAVEANQQEPENVS